MLPKVSTPTFTTEIPSTGEKIKYRSFLVKEEKILYIAVESRDEEAIVDAVLEILQNCILTPGIDIRKLCSFDIEFLFIRLRAKSVGEKTTISIGHSDLANKANCDHQTPIEIDLDAIKVFTEEAHTNVIQFGDGMGVKMRYPDLKKIIAIGNKRDMDSMFDVIHSCVEMVFDKEDTFTEFTKEELKEFIEALDKNKFSKIRDFFETMPTVRHDIDFTCEQCGKTETVVLKGLINFFT